MYTEKKTIFIDGSSGTAGLRIYDRLAQRADITLLTLPPEHVVAAMTENEQIRLHFFQNARQTLKPVFAYLARNSGIHHLSASQTSKHFWITLRITRASAKGQTVAKGEDAQGFCGNRRRGQQQGKEGGGFQHHLVHLV